MSPAMHCAVQGQQLPHAISRRRSSVEKRTSQARQTATRRRYEAEVNHVAAPCQRKRQVHLQQDVAVT